MPKKRPETDQVDYFRTLQARAEAGLPLFDGDGPRILRYVYWRARNGHDFAVGVVLMVNGQEVVQEWTDPRQDKAWLDYCQERRAYRAQRLEEIRRKDRIRKRKARLKKRGLKSWRGC